ncbi:MAG: hypothetical protein EP307_04050 [Rhodobacteraceae bacterium]|nr:MAG: hypothetical protein EP307_04050 [Paracoccaceae bacterium]
MSNIIQLTLPARNRDRAQRLTALAECFASERRFGDDVFWLKENAEYLNICETGGLRLPGAALDAYLGFYDHACERLTFFPQYYRFLLSITLDLEDLGMPGDIGARMVETAARQGLAEAELSDLQRAEARRLMARRGQDELAWDTGLDDRLRRFVGRTATFALPNKKAAYELTHVVFYLSEYGRRDPGLAPEAITSLTFAGVLAFLDQNADLLAEICVALRFAGQTPPRPWEDWLDRFARDFRIETGDHVSVQDAYHDYLVTNWYLAVRGREAFPEAPEAGRAGFTRRASFAGPLRAISDVIYRMGPMRSGDWSAMRPSLCEALDGPGCSILMQAADSVGNFDVFFHDFARAVCHGEPIKEAAV